jgi:membrane dipeptidase
MLWIDGHIDLAYVALQGRNILQPCPGHEKTCISIPDLTKSPIATFFGTIYTSPNDDTVGYGASANRAASFEAGSKQLNVYQALVNSGAVTMQHTGCVCTEQLSMLLLMEGADPIRSSEDVSWWANQGLRAVGLTWSTGTRYAGGNNCSHGITDEGRDVVASLDEHAIVHDVSHLSDASFDDLISIAKGPIIASHSNSRSVLQSDAQRHLRDDQAIEIFSRGGVVGLNLCTQFLSKTFDKNNTDATIDDCVEHILHFCDLAGDKMHVALGSDFDGGFSTKYLPVGLKRPGQITNLGDALRTAGFNEEELASFAHGAWMRVFN